MNIQCDSMQILFQWSADKDRLLSGAVLVEFTLLDESLPEMHLRSRLLEYVSFRTKPGYGETHARRWLEQRAYEQVVGYFEGKGNRENLFVERSLQNLSKIPLIKSNSDQKTAPHDKELEVGAVA